MGARERKGYKFREDEYARCPYYLRESAQEIRCIGITGYITGNIYKTKAEKEAYANDFCRDIKCWRGCPLAQAIIDNYDFLNDRGG